MAGSSPQAGGAHAGSSRRFPKIRLLIRIAFGFKDTNALIALAMLALAGYRPDLPGRTS